MSLETIAPVEEDVAFTQVSSLLVENHFHLLFNTDGEEDACRIVTAITLVIVSLLPIFVIRQHTFQLCTILRRICKETGRLEANVLHDLRAVVLRSL